MKNNTYIIRVNTIDNLYADYMVGGNNLLQAKHNAKKKFFEDYPDADKRIRLSVENVDHKVITEIMKIIYGESD